MNPKLTSGGIRPPRRTNRFGRADSCAGSIRCKDSAVRIERYFRSSPFQRSVEMFRHCIWIFVYVCCSGAVAAAPLRSELKVTAGPACLYNSKSFSDGAYICVQKSLMLNCSFDGTQATWKIVADRDINERCTAPMALNYPSEARPHARRRHAVHYRTHPVAERSAKCFVFNGKQYCE
jgi:hypothetical protein